MEKRFSTEDGMIIVSIIVPLSQDEEKKMENKKLQDRIDGAAKDYNIQWAIEKNNSLSMAIVSRMIGPEVNEDDCHQLEVIATKFIDFVDDLNLPDKKEEKVRKEEELLNEMQEKENFEFVQYVLKDFNGEESGVPIAGAVLNAFLKGSVEGIIHKIPCGTISRHLLKDMMEIYLASKLKKYGKKC